MKRLFEVDDIPIGTRISGQAKKLKNQKFLILLIPTGIDGICERIELSSN
jgi:hypothetical protein